MIRKHIPNTLTCCNLLCGCMAIVSELLLGQDNGLFFILLGAVFDFFDGFSARLLHVSSPIGKELDSLADVVTFGVAPSAVVAAFLMRLDAPLWQVCFPFLIAAFSALRLAKFNLDERQTTSFIGLPTPANALFWASLVQCLPLGLASSTYAMPLLLALIVASCLLLVSELPMFALKFKHFGWRGNEVRYAFLLCAIALLIALRSVGAWAAIIVLYVLISALIALRNKCHTANSQS